MKTNLKLLHNYVLIFPVPKKTQSQAGLIIAGNLEPNAPIEGLVLEVGPGKYLESGPKKGTLIECPVQKGDHVFFVKGQSKEIKFEGDTFLVVPSEDILCKVNKES